MALIGRLPEHLVELVHHLGGGGVFGGRLGVLAGGPLDAGELLLGARGVHDEAHASRDVGLADGCRFVGRPRGGSDAEEAEAEDDGLQHDQDEQVGQVQGEHLRG